MDKDISLAIKNLRIPLALLIVMGHSDIMHFPLMHGNEVVEFERSIVGIPIAYFCRVLFASANALFFIISGYLFFVSSDKFSRGDYFVKLRKRAKTLLVPYAIWQILFLIPSFVGVLRGKYDYDVTWFVQSMWSYPGKSIPADPPLWFLRDLMVCMVMSPLFFLVLKSSRIGLLSLFIILFCWLFELWPLSQPNGFSSLAISFFALGAFLGIHKVKMSVSSVDMGGGISVLFALVSIADCITTQYVPLELGNVQVVCIPWLNNMVILLEILVYPYLAIRYSKVLMRLDVGGSFVIYASHWGILIVVNAIIARMCPAEISPLLAMILFLIRVSCSLFGGLLLSRLINQNKILCQLFAGGRL